MDSLRSSLYSNLGLDLGCYGFIRMSESDTGTFVPQLGHGVMSCVGVQILAPCFLGIVRGHPYTKT